MVGFTFIDGMWCDTPTIFIVSFGFDDSCFSFRDVSSYFPSSVIKECVIILLSSKRFLPLFHLFFKIFEIVSFLQFKLVIALCYKTILIVIKGLAKKCGFFLLKTKEEYSSFVDNNVSMRIMLTMNLFTCITLG